MKQLTLPPENIPVSGEYDVAVVGGGVAGISAALSAARNGAKTILIEREFMLGGLATLGLVTIYLPLCDGEGHQVSFGISEELLRLSASRGCEIDTPWLHNPTDEEKKKNRFRVQYNASIFAILAEQLLVSEGVTLLYGSQLSTAVTCDEMISELILQNKEGRTAIRVGSVVDCTGDADVCAAAGAKTALSQQKNILASWYYSHENDKFRLNMLGACDIPEKYKTEEQSSRNAKRYTGITSSENTDFCISSHKTLLEHFEAHGVLSNNHAISTVATIPQLRMTRRLSGAYTMCDTELHKNFSSSIGMIGDWRKSGPIYELPFEILYGNEIHNLLCAGRCISVTDDMWDITRVIPACAVTGQAAGAAAALVGDLRHFDTALLQTALTRAGVVIHL